MDAPQNDAGTTTTTAPPPAAPQGAGAGDWSQAAQSAADGATQATGGAQAPPQGTQTPAGAPAGAAAPPAGTGAPTAPPAPVVITPQKRGGILGVVDSLADALAGKTRPEIATDQAGNKYVKETTLSHGQQWARIGAEAIKGAAAGWGAGRGAGNMGKAAEAGVESGEQGAQQRKQNQQEMTAQARQQNLDRANNQLLQMQMAEHAWNATRLQVKATQEDEDWADKKSKDLEDAHAVLLGTTAHAGDISHLMQAHPDLMKSLVGYKGAEQDLKFVPNYENGQAAGFKVYRTMPGYNQTVVAEGGLFHSFDPTTGKLIEHHASGPSTQGELDQYDTAAYNAQAKWNNDKAELAAKAATTAEAVAKTKVAPTEAAKNLAEAGKATAEADAARANAALVTPGPAGGGAAALAQYPEPIQAAVKGLLDYRTDPATFPQRKFAKSGQMDRETAIGLAQQVDPSYDEKQFKTRSKLLTDFTSGEAATNIRSINTAIGHLDRMAKSGAALQNTNVQGYNAVKNTVGPWFGSTAPGQFNKDVNAVSNELSALFKRTSGTDQEIKSWKDTMSAAQTPAQIKTGIDEALELMNGRYDALDHQFSTGMGRPRDFQMLSPESVSILNNLGAKEFVQKDAAAGQPAAAAGAPPAGAVGTAMHKGDNRSHYVDAKGNDLGVAQ